jgi:hypothetical protein
MSRDRHASDYMGRVKSLPCTLCSLLGQPQSGVTEAHHIRTGHGMGDRASDFLTVALCVDCHRGTHGFHGTKALMRIAKLSEMDLLAETVRQMDKNKGRGYLPSKGDASGGYETSPVDSTQEEAVGVEDIKGGQTIQPRVPPRKRRQVRSGQTSPV